MSDGPVFSRGDHVELAVNLLAHLEGTGEPVIFDAGALHRYEPARGLWTPIESTELSTVSQSFAGAKLDTGRPLKIRASDISGAVQLASARATRRDFFTGGPIGLAFANGFVEVTGDAIRMRPLSPENRARFGYSFDFSANGASKPWLQFLQDLFRDEDDREERIAFLQEFFGACLLGVAPRFQRCVVGQGPGDDGKSTLGQIISAAMPSGSVCSVAPQAMSHEYRRAKLAGKLFNLVTELPEADILESEAFKSIVTGDLIDARPIREAPFDFRPIAGHAFFANRLPATDDQTHGFWRRFVVVTFRRRFTEEPGHDPIIASKLIASELPAVVAWLVAGAHRVMRTGRYTLPTSHAKALASWRRNADQVALFLSDRCAHAKHSRPTPDTACDWTRADELYRAYRTWCDTNGHRSMASNKFGARMHLLALVSVKVSAGWFYPVKLLRNDEHDMGMTDFACPMSVDSREKSNGYN